MSRSVNRSTEWDRRWAPTHHWSTLVLSKKFREEVTDFVFDIRSNRKYYRSEAPGTISFNYCPLCAVGQRYECLFFHPSVANLFLDVVKSLDQSKREPELNNIEVTLRIIKQLPSIFASVGHPCYINEYGAVWSCIMDKLDQLFPYNCLLMVNNSHYMELHKQLYLCESGSDADTDIDELEGHYFPR